MRYHRLRRGLAWKGALSFHMSYLVVFFVWYLFFPLCFIFDKVLFWELGPIPFQIVIYNYNWSGKLMKWNSNFDNFLRISSVGQFDSCWQALRYVSVLLVSVLLVIVMFERKGCINFIIIGMSWLAFSIVAACIRSLTYEIGVTHSISLLSTPRHEWEVTYRFWSE